MHSSASSSPAANPPGTSTPASMTRAPFTERPDADSQLAGAVYAGVCHQPRALVHPQVAHTISHPLVTGSVHLRLTTPLRQR